MATRITRKLTFPCYASGPTILQKEGVDPDEQLCTDDFAGHLAHNVNLSAKAIVGVAAYGYIAALAGEPNAEEYMESARKMAQDWASRADDGDHTRLTFDRPGTWSQKYNIVWDDLFGFDLFSDEIEQRELAFYRTKMNKYGLPLDSRKTYTKTDWTVWSAALADSKEEFAPFISPIYKFINETPDRVPFTDWYETTDATCVGFRARQVIGGVYIWLLKDQWKKEE